MANRARWAASGVVGVLLAVVGYAVVTRGHPDAAPAPDARPVAVAWFENRSGDPQLDHLARITTDWVTRGIARTSLVEVLDETVLYLEERSLAGEQVDPFEMARRHGASFVVSGNYFRSRDSVYFSANIVAAPERRILRAVDPVAGPAVDPLPAVEELRQRVVVALGTVLDPRVSSFSSAENPPPRYAAYEAYVMAQEVYWRGEFTEAMKHFRRAAELDLDFVGAPVWIAVNAVGIARCDVVDSIYGVLAGTMDRLVSQERHMLEVSRARCATHWEEVLRLQRVRADLYPGSSFWRWTAGMAARRANRPAEALTFLEGIDPGSELGWLADPAKVFYWREVAAAQHMLGDRRAERRTAERLSRTGPGRLASAYHESRALVGLDRPAAALRALEGIELLPPDPPLVAGELLGRSRPEWIGVPGWVLYQIATELLAHRHPAAALVAAERAVRWFRSRPADEQDTPEHQLVLAQSLDLLGRHDEAIRVVERLASASPRSIEYQGTLGTLHARRRDRAAAMRIDHWLSDHPPDYPTGAPALYRARIAAVLGDHERAMDLLETLPHRLHPVDFLLFHSDPALLPLHGEPRFQRLIRPRG